MEGRKFDSGCEDDSVIYHKFTTHRQYRVCAFVYVCVCVVCMAAIATDILCPGLKFQLPLSVRGVLSASHTP